MQCQQLLTDDSQNQLRQQSRCPIFKKVAVFFSTHPIGIPRYLIQSWKNFQNLVAPNFHHWPPQTSSRCSHYIPDSFETTTTATQTGTTTSTSRSKTTTIYTNSCQTYTDPSKNIRRCCHQTRTIISSTNATRTSRPPCPKTSSISSSGSRWKWRTQEPLSSSFLGNGNQYH